MVLPSGPHPTRSIEAAARSIRGTDLAERVGLTQANLSKLKTGRVKAIRFSTLQALCRELDCQPGDLLSYVED